MVPAWSLIASLVGVSVCFGGLFLVLLSRVGRVAAGSLVPEKEPMPVALAETLVDPQVIRVLSERLAVLEGRLPAMQAMNDGYSAMALRLAQLEAQVPNLHDAFDKMSQMTLNADKRAADRDKRGRNKTQTVEEAAAQMGMAANPKAALLPANGAARAPLPAGVMGSGGTPRR